MSRSLLWRRCAWSVAAIVLAGLSNSGCGYALAGTGSFLPDYIKTIGVPTFTNRTTVFNLETQITDKVRSEFIGRGRYEILPDSLGVDALLTGEVSSVSLIPASFTDQQLASRYIIMMVARVELKDLRDNKILWDNPSLLFRQEYEGQSSTGINDPAAFFSQDLNALERLTTDFARTIVSAILEAF